MMTLTHHQRQAIAIELLECAKFLAQDKSHASSLASMRMAQLALAFYNVQNSKQFTAFALEIAHYALSAKTPQAELSAVRDEIQKLFKERV